MAKTEADAAERRDDTGKWLANQGTENGHIAGNDARSKNIEKVLKDCESPKIKAKGAIKTQSIDAVAKK